MITLYNVVSSDGFIARNDGSEDFIPNDLWQNFLDLCVEYRTLVIGRETYDKIQSYDNELLVPFEKLPIKKVVVTRNRTFYPKQGYMVTHSPKDAVVVSSKVLVTSGPTLNNFLLKEGLVNKIIFHEVPISIGEGIVPFDEENVTLCPVENHQKLEGVKVHEYRVVS